MPIGWFHEIHIDRAVRGKYLIFFDENLGAKKLSIHDVLNNRQQADSQNQQATIELICI